MGNEKNRQLREPSTKQSPASLTKDQRGRIFAENARAIVEQFAIA